MRTIQFIIDKFAPLVTFYADKTAPLVTFYVDKTVPLITFYIERFVRSIFISIEHIDEAVSRTRAELHQYIRPSAGNIERAIVSLKLFLAFSFAHEDEAHTEAKAFLKTFAKAESEVLEDDSVSFGSRLFSGMTHWDDTKAQTAGRLNLYAHPVIETIEDVIVAFAQTIGLRPVHIDEADSEATGFLKLFAKISDAATHDGADVRPHSTLAAKGEHIDEASAEASGWLAEYIRPLTETIEDVLLSFDSVVAAKQEHIDLAETAFRAAEKLFARTGDVVTLDREDTRAGSVLRAKANHEDVARATTSARVLEYIRIAIRTTDRIDVAMDGKMPIHVTHLDYARYAIGSFLKQFEKPRIITHEGISIQPSYNILARPETHRDEADMQLAAITVIPNTLADIANETLAEQAVKSMFDVSYRTV